MLPTIRESHTYYRSKSGKTRIYMSIETEETAFNRFIDRLKENNCYLLKQKLLGVTLIILGIIGFVAFPEDNGGFLFPALMGLARLIY